MPVMFLFHFVCPQTQLSSGCCCWFYVQCSSNFFWWQLTVILWHKCSKQCVSQPISFNQVFKVYGRTYIDSISKIKNDNLFFFSFYFDAFVFFVWLCCVLLTLPTVVQQSYGSVIIFSSNDWEKKLTRWLSHRLSHVSRLCLFKSNLCLLCPAYACLMLRSFVLNLFWIEILFSTSYYSNPLATLVFHNLNNNLIWTLLFINYLTQNLHWFDLIWSEP